MKLRTVIYWYRKRQASESIRLFPSPLWVEAAPAERAR
jgi:hypothetical protein